MHPTGITANLSVPDLAEARDFYRDFLGLSVEAPAATWGSMIAEGKRHLSSTVWVALVPSLVMFLTVLSLNFVGDILRSRFDVKESAL